MGQKQAKFKSFYQVAISILYFPISVRLATKRRGHCNEQPGGNI